MIPVLFCKILSLISFILLVVGTAFPEWESLPTGKSILGTDKYTALNSVEYVAIWYKTTGH